MITNTILVVSSQVVSCNSKINWPDLNYPGTGQTILRTLHNIDYVNLTYQLDNSEGPVFNVSNSPNGVAFFSKINNLP